MTPNAERLLECDRQLQQMLGLLQRYAGDVGKPKRRSQPKNAPAFDLRNYLYGVCGVDLTRIDGVDVTTAHKV